MNALMARQRLEYVLSIDRALCDCPPERLKAVYGFRNNCIFGNTITVLDEKVVLHYDPLNQQGSVFLTVEYKS
jgi:hypothetical protein